MNDDQDFPLWGRRDRSRRWHAHGGIAEFAPERSGFFLSKLLLMIRPVRCPIGFHSGWGALEYLMTRMDKAFEIGLFGQLTRCIPKEFGQRFYLGLL